MNIVSVIQDGLLKAKSLLLEMKVEEYLELAPSILDKNKYQRRRVQNSSTMYSMLSRDLLQLCTMPPIVLAFDMNGNQTTLDTSSCPKDVLNLLKTDNLIILDGLQRTYTMLSVLSDLTIDDDVRRAYLDHTIRVELYDGLSKTGILYRMLTLNCGQTPMSKRHEIEILYSDYDDGRLRDISLIRQISISKKNGLGEYDFDDAIEGFNSFLNGDEAPIDRLKLLDIIERMEKITNDDYSKDIFVEFIRTYNSLVRHIDVITGSWAYDKERHVKVKSVYGKDIPHVFSKAQTISAFGAAIGSLMGGGKLTSLDHVKALEENIAIGTNTDDVFNKLLSNLDTIRQRAPKIGVEQRVYLRMFFTHLYDSSSIGYCDLMKSIQESFNQYSTEKWNTDTTQPGRLF